MFRIVLFYMLALFSMSTGLAQQPESTSISVPLTSINCVNGSTTIGLTQVFFLENYFDGQLPATVYIPKTKVWNESGTAPLTASPQGNTSIWIDPQQTNVKQNVGREKIQGQTFKDIATYEFGAGAARVKNETFDPPVAYRAGDIMGSAPECSNGGSLLLYLQVYILSPFADGTVGDLLNLPVAPTPLKVNADNASINQGGISVRQVVPAPTAAFSRCRAKIYASDLQIDSGGNHNTLVNNMSVCLQSGASSSCQAVPIEMKFGTRSGMTLYPRQQLWTDWTPISGTAGQQLLVTGDMFPPAGSTNAWTAASVGPGGWASTAPSYNTVAPQGIIYSNPTNTNLINMVQCQ